MLATAPPGAPRPLLPGPGHPRAIIHLDMDCFFASGGCPCLHQVGVSWTKDAVWIGLGVLTWLAGWWGMAWSAHPLQDAETQVVGPWWLCRGVSGPIIFDACLPSVVFRGLMAEQAPSCCGGAGLRWAGLSEHGRDKVVHPHTAVSAAVTEAKHPLLRGKPLAVCHSASTRGTGEVSTCNYEARR